MFTCLQGNHDPTLVAWKPRLTCGYSTSRKNLALESKRSFHHAKNSVWKTGAANQPILSFRAAEDKESSGIRP